MFGAKLLIVSLLVLLSVVSGRAQAPANGAPTAPQQQLTVRLVLPTTVGLIGEYADILLSKDENKLKKLTTRRRPRTSNPTYTFAVPLPKSWLTRKLIKDK
jgi:hypothetical protein